MARKATVLNFLLNKRTNINPAIPIKANIAECSILILTTSICDSLPLRCWVTSRSAIEAGLRVKVPGGLSLPGIGSSSSGIGSSPVGASRTGFQSGREVITLVTPLPALTSQMTISTRQRTIIGNSLIVLLTREKTASISTSISEVNR